MSVLRFGLFKFNITHLQMCADQQSTTDFHFIILKKHYDTASNLPPHLL